MIESYKCRQTEELAREGKCARRFSGFREQAERRLRILEAAPSLNALRLLRSNRFEALHGDREGQYSIRINMQYRICFKWPEGASGPREAEIVDYLDRDLTGATRTAMYDM